MQKMNAFLQSAIVGNELSDRMKYHYLSQSFYKSPNTCYNDIFDHYKFDMEPGVYQRAVNSLQSRFIELKSKEHLVKENAERINVADYRNYKRVRKQESNNVSSEESGQIRSEGREKPVCRICKKVGHIARYCFLKDRPCYVCGKKGHIAINCFKRGQSVNAVTVEKHPKAIEANIKVSRPKGELTKNFIAKNKSI
jgi:hypothetical protein